jgi:YD repeat-containing protein
VTDANGVAMTFDYQAGNVIRIHDDNGHLLTLNYANNKLVSVSEVIDGAQLPSSTRTQQPADPGDRPCGHVTKYHYNKGQPARQHHCPPNRLRWPTSAS